MAMNITGQAMSQQLSLMMTLSFVLANRVPSFAKLRIIKRRDSEDHDQSFFWRTGPGCLAAALVVLKNKDFLHHTRACKSANITLPWDERSAGPLFSS